MDWDISISAAACALVWDNCFSELFAGIEGNLTLLMTNADAELFSFLCYKRQSMQPRCTASFALADVVTVFSKNLFFKDKNFF